MGNVLSQPLNSNMDESLWCQMPPEILLRVLVFLPLSKLFQLRCVCKRWASIVYCPNFLRICTEVEAPWMDPHPAVCFVYNCGGFRWSAFDYASQEWHMMPTFPETGCPRRRELNAGMGGLFCLLEFGNIDLLYALMVWNPLTNESKDLPKLGSSWSNPLVWHMLEDVKHQSYKIILSGNQNFEVEDERYLTTEVYDSVSETWREGGRLLSSLRFPFSNGAMCNGMLYYLASRPTTMYDILIEYNLDENEWREVPHIIPTNTFCTPYLFEWEGRLLMMMHLLSEAARFASCAIYSLDLLTMHWELLIEMPQNMYMDFAYIGGCMASGKHLCVTGNAPNRDLIVAIYETNRNTWLWLPPCPLSSSEHIERHNTFTYFPNLLAIPTTSKSSTTTSTQN